MEPIQIPILIFALFAFSRGVLRARDKSITKNEFLFWSVIWILIIVVTLIPKVADVFAQIFGIGRGLDLALYGGMIILFYLVFRLYVKLEGTEQNITKIVREIAIERERK
ncbi:DUF2304 domain-containing protein [Nanoarchaeota archaeon]